MSDELRDLTKSVNELTKTVASGMATLTTKVDTLQASHTASATEIRKIKSDQDSCEARTGFRGVNARLKEQQQEDKELRVHIDTQLDNMRGDATGRVEEALLKAAQAAPRPNGSNGFRELAFRALPYILLFGMFLGAWLISGGDKEKTLQMFHTIREIGLKVEKIEKNNGHPVYLPVSTEAYSESTLEE